MPLYLRFVLYLQLLNGDLLSLHTLHTEFTYDDNLIIWTTYGNKTYRTRLGSIHKTKDMIMVINVKQVAIAESIK